MLLQPGTLPGLLSSGRRKRGLDLEAWATGCPGEGLMGAWRGGGGLCDGQHGLTDCTSPWLCGDRHTGGRGHRELPAPSPQFCCKPKSALKTKLKKKKPNVTQPEAEGCKTKGLVGGVPAACGPLPGVFAEP